MTFHNVPTPKGTRNRPALIEPDDNYEQHQQLNNMLAEQLLNNISSPTTTDCHLANAVVDPVSGAVYEYRHLARGPDAHIWKRSLANDLGRLAQGVGTRMPKGTNTIFWKHPSQIPKHKKVSYCRLVTALRPKKAETHRVRVTVGGDRLEYDGNCSTDCASLALVKTHLNSTISTDNARYATLDIKDYYYGTPMKEYEYVRMSMDIIPDEIRKQYDLDRLAVNGWAYMEIRKGMPGLKQAGKIAHERLTEHLAKYGYHPCRHTPALWRHITRPISFTLVVDDFGVKYVGRQHLNHLIDALRAQYKITVDLSGNCYLGLTIEWNYLARYVDISMPDYVQKALHEFQHPAPKRPTHSPSKWTAPTYGARIQYAPPPSTTQNPLTPEASTTYNASSVSYFTTPSQSTTRHSSPSTTWAANKPEAPRPP